MGTDERLPGSRGGGRSVGVRRGPVGADCGGDSRACTWGETQGLNAPMPGTREGHSPGERVPTSTGHRRQTSFGPPLLGHLCGPAAPGKMGVGRAAGSAPRARVVPWDPRRSSQRGRAECNIPGPKFSFKSCLFACTGPRGTLTCGSVQSFWAAESARGSDPTVARVGLAAPWRLGSVPPTGIQPEPPAAAKPVLNHGTTGDALAHSGLVSISQLTSRECRSVTKQEGGM